MVVVEMEEVEQRTTNHWCRAEQVLEEKEEVEQRTRNHWWRAENGCGGGEGGGGAADH